MFAFHVISLFALNVAIASLLCTSLALIISACFGSLPKRYATLVVGLIACSLAPLVVALGTAYSLGRLPAIPTAVNTINSDIELGPDIAIEEREFSPASAQHFISEQRSNAPEAAVAAPATIPIQELASRPPAAPPNRSSASASSFWPSLNSSLLAIWLLGSLLMLGWYLRKLWLCHRFLAACQPVTDSSVQSLFASVSRRIGTHDSIPLLQSASLPTPVVIALARPVVIVPADIQMSLSTHQLASVFAHELSHIARKDHWAATLQTMTRILYWWNPLVYWVSRRASELREMICDDIATSVDIAPKEYAKTIIQMAERTAATRELVGSLGISLSPISELERRLRRIIAEKTHAVDLCISKRFASVLCILSLVLATGLLFAQVPQATEDRSSSQSPNTSNPDATEQIVPAASDRTLVTSDAIDEKIDKPSSYVPLAGDILDMEGKPVVGAKVFATIGPNDTAAQTASNVDGWFVLGLPSLGDKPLISKLWAESADGSQLGFFRFPNRKTTATLEKVKLTVEPVKLARIQVVDAMGKPIADANAAIDLGVPYKLGPIKTDAEGIAVFKVPVSSKINSAIAWKDGYGMDYRLYTLSTQRRSDVNAQVPEFPATEAEVLTLEGASPLAVQVTDDQNRPVNGAAVDALQLRKNRSGDQFNLSYFSGLINTITDANGNASFDWFPTWQTEAVIVFARADNFVRKQITASPAQKSVIVLQRPVLMKGKVELPGGRAVAGITIVASGRSKNVADSFRGQAMTDVNGRYEIPVAPNQTYKLIVQDHRWSAPVQSGISISSDQSTQERNFTLTEAARIHGKVVDQYTGQGVSNCYVALTQFALGTDAIRSSVSPTPMPVQRLEEPLQFLNTTTNDRGEFEFFIGDGDYELSIISFDGNLSSTREKTSIRGEKDKEVNLTVQYAQQVKFAGRIVSNSSGEPLAGTVVTGVSQGTDIQDQWSAVTDSTGLFKVQARNAEYSISAMSADRKQGAAASVKANGTEFQMRLVSLGSAKGRLLKDDGTAPMANERLNVLIKESLNANMVRLRIVDDVTTDSQGNFSLPHLIPGISYSFSPANLQGLTFDVQEIKVQPGQSLNLGDIRSPKPSTPQIDTTSQSNMPAPVISDRSNLAVAVSEPSNTTGSKQRAKFITGTVIDARGMPVANAEVIFQANLKKPEIKYVANADGHFKIAIDFNPLHLHSTILRAYSPDGRHGYYRFRFAENNPVYENIEILVEEQSDVGLQVVDAVGSPISNANVAFQLASPYIIGPLTTDSQGNATGKAPHSEKILAALAWKDGQGLDYRVYVNDLNRASMEHHISSSFAEGKTEVLKLEGAAPLRMRIIDRQTHPLSNSSAHVWLLKKPDQSQQLNLSMFYDSFSQKADADGSVNFDWFPKWQQDEVQVWAEAEGYLSERVHFDPKLHDYAMIAAMRPSVWLHGNVSFSDGRPASNIFVTANIQGGYSTPFTSGSKPRQNVNMPGFGYRNLETHFAVQPDAHGHFDVAVEADRTYSLSASDKHWIAPTLGNIKAQKGQSDLQFDMVLKPTTRLHGKLLSKANGKPISDMVVLKQVGIRDNSNSATRADANSATVIAMSEKTTNFDGHAEFQFYVGDGDYELSIPDDTLVQRVSVNGEAELKVDLYTSKRDLVELTGTIVFDSDDRVASQASLLGASRNLANGSDWTAVTDADGKFTALRLTQAAYVRALSHDGHLGAITNVSAHTRQIQMRLLPLGTVTGRLISPEHSEPIADQTIEYGIKIEAERGGGFKYQFGGTVKTDSNGEFKITGLVPHWQYQFMMQDTINRNLVKLPITDVTCDSGQQFDLGDVLRPPTPNFRPFNGSDTNFPVPVKELEPEKEQPRKP